MRDKSGSCNTSTALRYRERGNPGLTGPLSGRVAQIEEECGRFKWRCIVTSRLDRGVLQITNDEAWVLLVRTAENV